MSVCRGHELANALYVPKLPVLYMWLLQARCGLLFTIINHTYTTSCSAIGISLTPLHCLNRVCQPYCVNGYQRHYVISPRRLVFEGNCIHFQHIRGPSGTDRGQAHHLTSPQLIQQELMVFAPFLSLRFRTFLLLLSDVCIARRIGGEAVHIRKHLW